MKKKKILLISNMYPNNKNKSYGIFVKNTYDELISNGYDVTLSVLYKENNKIKKLFNYIKFINRNIKLSKKNNYDYVYYHFISHSCIGIKYMKFKNAKVVMNVHGNDIVNDDDNLANINRSKKYIKYADKVIAPSEYFKNVLIEKYNCDEKIISVYPAGGVNLSVFKKMKKEDAIKKLKKYGINDKTKYIGFASRIEMKKGYDIFASAINIIKNKKEFRDYKFIIVGSGGEEHLLHELINKYKLEDRIILIPSLPHEELVCFYNILDAFVFPTYRPSESLGLVGLEAMATGTPLIVSDGYGPATYASKINAYPFKMGSVSSLANTLLKFVNDNNKEEKINNALTTVKNYEVKKVSKILIKIFDSMGEK